MKQIVKNNNYNLEIIDKLINKNQNIKTILFTEKIHSGSKIQS